MRNLRGFTLVELLAVIAIIGILSGIVIVGVSYTRGIAQDAKRASDIQQLKLIIEAYWKANRAYPVSIGSAWSTGTSACNATYGAGNPGYGATGYIPGLVPDYIKVLPEDSKVSSNHCYLYKSNGTDYKLITWNTVEHYDSHDQLADPGYGGTAPNCNTVPGRANTYAVYSPGGMCF